MIAMPTLTSLASTPCPRSLVCAAPALVVTASSVSATTVIAATPIFHFDGWLTSVRAMLSPPYIRLVPRGYDARRDLSRHADGGSTA
jgi:hypothetical protein